MPHSSSIDWASIFEINLILGNVFTLIEINNRDLKSVTIIPSYSELASRSSGLSHEHEETSVRKESKEKRVTWRQKASCGVYSSAAITAQSSLTNELDSVTSDAAGQCPTLDAVTPEGRRRLGWPPERTPLITTVYSECRSASSWRQQTTTELLLVRNLEELLGVRAAQLSWALVAMEHLGEPDRTRTEYMSPVRDIPVELDLLRQNSINLYVFVRLLRSIESRNDIW